MRIVVTGATGLIGTALVKNLRDKAVVVGLTRGKAHKECIQTDYSFDSLCEAFRDADAVIHLAAIRGRGNDYEHFMENALLTENVLKAAVRDKVARVIFLSSIAVYSDPAQVPWKEEQALRPQTFYGLSKIVGEHLCELYAEKGLRYTIFRCGIVLGITRNQRMTDVFIENAAEKKPITVKGKSVAKRDFIYLKEVVNAICWAALEDTSVNQVYNLGGGSAYTNLEMAEAINKAFGNEGNLVYLDQYDEQMNDSRMDSSKVTKAGFCRRYDLDSALDDIRKDWVELHEDI